MPDTPYSILDNQISQLQNYYKNKEQQIRIRRLPKAQHNAEIANIQAESDAQKFKISSMRTQLDNIYKSNIDPALRDEAMWKLVIPPEHAAAMFPTEQEPVGAAPYSPAQLKAFEPSVQEFAQAAESVAAFWARRSKEERKQPGLIRQYVGWREHFGYSDPKMTNTRRRQMDEVWDDIMAGAEFYEWDPASPQIKALRTYGGRITGIVAKKISPLAKSIQTGMPSKAEQRQWALGKFIHPLRAGPMPESRILDADTAGAILREAGSDKEKARQIAKQRGYKL